MKFSTTPIAVIGCAGPVVEAARAPREWTPRPGDRCRCKARLTAAELEQLRAVQRERVRAWRERLGVEERRRRGREEQQRLRDRRAAERRAA